MKEPQSQIMEENGKRYRMLQVGETIEKTDEVYLAPNWETMAPTKGGVVSEATAGDGWPFGYYRRECK